MLPCEEEFAWPLVPRYLVGMASVVYLTSRAPSKLTDDLILAGHRAWECLSVSVVICGH
jgi:hypothetical protein